MIAHTPSIGYFNSEWVPRDSIRISINDIGFRLGVTAVERLRTYHQRVFGLSEHLARFEHTTSTLQILGLPATDQLRELMDELLSRNGLSESRQSSTSSSRDTGITLFATPGELGGVSPTIVLHLNTLDFARGEKFRTQGQALAITDVTQPPESTWPRGLKVRCRLHYHRADMTARQWDKDAVGILIDGDGSLTETSIANFALVKHGQIYSPLASQVLGGVTQHFVEKIARSLGIEWTKRKLFPDQLYDADEVLLMGTDHGVWFANQVDSINVRKAESGRVFHSLSNSFSAVARGNTNL